MIKEYRLTTRLFTSAFVLLSLQATPSLAQRGILQDQGGAVFNVKAYGATADDKTDDTSAIQDAIDAATKARGGVVYFPAGRYVLNGTLHDDRADMVSLRCRNGQPSVYQEQTRNLTCLKRISERRLRISQWPNPGSIYPLH